MRVTAASPLEAWQREVLSELRQIRQLLERPQGRPSTLSKTDRAMLERLLQALAVVFPGGELFTSRELVEHPAPGLRVLRRGLSTKQIGRLLTRADGIAIGGFKVEKVGSELHVCLWRVIPG
jgi:hypothetical protein